MWTQMRLLFALQRSQVLQAQTGTESIDTPVSSAELLACATLGGATACMLKDEVGTLTVGKQADIVLLRTDSIHARPINDLVSAVVHNMDARNVDTVMVSGRVLKRDGNLLGVDLPALYARMDVARDRVFASAGRAVSDR
jgi:5-methylthioadenosine/S-adenosylhomocysteine deaminase